MSDRVIKFRAWDTTPKRMILLELQHVSSFSHSDYYKLMQFTGLHDRNGKEIYEGDIIQRPCVGIPMLVRWNVKNAGFDLTMRDPKDFDAVAIWYTYLSQTDYEVIGNVYEHPGLLKEGDQ